MARLPIVGQDDGHWGDILNDYLVQSHALDGTLKIGSVGADQLQANSVSSAQLQVSAVTADHLAAGAVTKADIGLANVDNTADADKPVSTAAQMALDSKADIAALAAKLDAAQKGSVNGVAPLDTNGLLPDEHLSTKVLTVPNLIPVTPHYVTIGAPNTSDGSWFGSGVFMTVYTWTAPASGDVELQLPRDIDDETDTDNVECSVWFGSTVDVDYPGPTDGSGSFGLDALCYLNNSQSTTQSLSVVAGQAYTVMAVHWDAANYTGNRIDLGLLDAKLASAGLSEAIFENEEYVIDFDGGLRRFSMLDGASVRNRLEGGGRGSFLEGSGTAAGYMSHSEGDGRAYGIYSHAEGNSYAAGAYSHAEGAATAVRPYESARGASIYTVGTYPVGYKYGSTSFSGPQILTLFNDSADPIQLDMFRAFYIEGRIMANVPNASTYCVWKFSTLVACGNPAAARLVGTPSITKEFADSAASTWTLTVGVSNFELQLTVDAQSTNIYAGGMITQMQGWS